MIDSSYVNRKYRFIVAFLEAFAGFLAQKEVESIGVRVVERKLRYPVRSPFVMGRHRFTYAWRVSEHVTAKWSHPLTWKLSGHGSTSRGHGPRKLSSIISCNHEPSFSLSLLLARDLLFTHQPPRDLLFKETIPRSANYRLKNANFNEYQLSREEFNNSRSRDLWDLSSFKKSKKKKEKKGKEKRKRRREKHRKISFQALITWSRNTSLPFQEIASKSFAVTPRKLLRGQDKIFLPSAA